jgi:CRISPR-associated protein Csb3
VRLRTVLERFRGATLQEERAYQDPPPWGDAKAWPVEVRWTEGWIVLDPWLKPDHSKVARGLKLWSGQMTSLRLLQGLHMLLPPTESVHTEGLFEWGAPGTPSGLDFRSAVSKEDLGFSYDGQGLKPVVYPFTDLLALVGLQGARPRRVGPSSFVYFLWEVPLPSVLARAALIGALPGLASSRWIYMAERRGLGGTYWYLTRAEPLEEDAQT